MAEADQIERLAQIETGDMIKFGDRKQPLEVTRHNIQIKNGETTSVRFKVEGNRGGVYQLNLRQKQRRDDFIQIERLAREWHTKPNEWEKCGRVAPESVQLVEKGDYEASDEEKRLLEYDFGDTIHINLDGEIVEGIVDRFEITRGSVTLWAEDVDEDSDRRSYSITLSASRFDNGNCNVHPEDFLADLIRYEGDEFEISDTPFTGDDTHEIAGDGWELDYDEGTRVDFVRTDGAIVEVKKDSEDYVIRSQLVGYSTFCGIEGRADTRSEALQMANEHMNEFPGEVDAEDDGDGDDDDDDDAELAADGGCGDEDQEAMTDGGETPADVLERIETDLQKIDVTFDDGDQITVQVQDRSSYQWTDELGNRHDGISVELLPVDTETSHPDHEVELYNADFSPEGDRTVEAVGWFFADAEYQMTNTREIVAVEPSEDQEVMADGGKRRVPEKGERALMAYYSERAGRVIRVEGEVDHASRCKSRVYADDELPEPGNGHMEAGIHGYVIEDGSDRKLSFNTASFRAGSFGDEQYTHLGDLVSIDFEGDAADPTFPRELADGEN